MKSKLFCIVLLALTIVVVAWSRFVDGAANDGSSLEYRVKQLEVDVKGLHTEVAQLKQVLLKSK